MYNFNENNSTQLVTQLNQPSFPIRNKPKNGKSKIFRKAVSLVLSAAIFGIISGGGFYGVNYVLENSELTASQNSSQSDSVSLSALSYSSGDSSQSVSDIAEKGLSSVVSVTNISVQEVQNYFGQFWMGGRGPAQLQETTSCGSGVIINSSDTELYIVTNYHVVEGATTLSVTFADDQTYEAQLCGYDESIDVAMLKVSISAISSDTLSEISVIDIGDSEKEIGAIFLAMGTGLIVGMGYLGYGFLCAVILGFVSALYSRLDFGAQKKNRLYKTLHITIPEDLDYTDVFDPILGKYTNTYELTQVKTTNMGSLFRLTYNLTLNSAGKEKEMIDKLRCRNGNLEISISNQETVSSEL